ncbi:uncharacterized protein LOC142652534 [Rhinoderma darwinii]|uniref:uncharacterized protein LOC142652534 n=1 Tax=Rhinoderma darwinii TaxID=43563 RepID=UPI003F664003
MQNPKLSDQSVPQTTAEKMQNNNKVSQNPSLQNVPNPNVKPKFSCNICKFACSSLQNFRIHLQTAHCQASEKTQNMSAIINAAKPKGNAAENVQPAKPKGNAAENVQPAKPKGNAAVNVQPAKPIWNAVVSNVQPAKPKGNAAVNVQPGPIPDSSGRYIAPVKDYMSRADKEPLIAKPKGNAAVNVQPGPIPDSSGRYIAPLKDYMSRADKVPLIAKPNWNTAANVQPGPIPGNSGRYIAPLKDYVSRADREPLIAMPKGNAAANVQPAQLKWNAVVSNVQPGPIPDSSGRYIATLKDYVSRADREPLIGLEYVLEYRVKTTANQIETKYFCDLCECDADVDPMVEHLAGFGHRKLYLAKDYPYVLKAQSNSKEDQSRFIRRMALEIEREEGTKTYMIDSSIWMETMMTLRAASKKMKKKTRWDNDKNKCT